MEHRNHDMERNILKKEVKYKYNRCHYFTVYKMVSTVAAALVFCGVEYTDINSIIGDGNLSSSRIGGEIKDANFDAFMSITWEEWDDHWSSYAAITINDGKIDSDIQQRQRSAPLYNGLVIAFV